MSGDLWPHDDPRWPTVCDGCDYVFAPTDAWQLFTDHEYQREGGQDRYALRDAPVGAMWVADWYRGFGSPEHEKRGGGPHLIVKTPAGDWDIDAPSRNGSGWTRTGTPPKVTARPSIGIGNPFVYHAFLTDGILEDC